MSTPQKLSVLNACSVDDVEVQPYHHIVCDQLYPSSFYDRLSQTFPEPEFFLKHLPAPKSNQAVRIPASSVIGNDTFSAEWREFFQYHTSDAFWRDIVTVFGEGLRETYPDLENRIGKPMHEWRTRLRGTAENAELDMDLLFVINTPVKQESSVRPAHVDGRKKIFSGLFYMKQEHDPTPGGDLSLYEFKKQHGGFGGHYANLNDLNETATVPYGANKFIGFINSQASIHGVTPRPQTEWTRRYINFVVEMPFEVFKLPKLPVHQQWMSWLERRMAHKAPGVDIQLNG